MQIAQDYREFQLKIDNLSEQGIEEISNWILESKIYKKTSDPFEITKLLLEFTYVKPKKLKILSELATKILEKSPLEKQINTLIQIFKNSNPKPFGKLTSHNAIFFMNCVDKLNIEKTSIIDHLEQLFTDELFERDDNYILYLFLGPDLEKYKPALFKNILAQFRESQPKWMGDLAKIKVNNWTALKQNRENDGVKNSLSYAIRNDKLSDFKFDTITSKFNINKELEATIYDPNIFIIKTPTIFDYALFYGSRQIVDFIMLQYLPKFPEIKQDPTHARYAVAGGNIEIIKMLKDENFSFDGCLHVAAIFHQREVFDWLYEEQKNQTSRDFPPVLHCSIMRLNFDLAIKLIEDGFDVNETDQSGFNALHTAILSRSLAMVELVLSTGRADVNAADSDGRTPLIISVEECCDDITSRLLEIKDIKVDETDMNGMTALAYAAIGGYITSLKKLLSRDDIDVNQVDEEGMTPIMSAFGSDEIEACIVLANDKRVDLTVKNMYGSSMLHVAAGSTSLELFEAVLARSDASEKDEDGKTITHIAAESLDPGFIKAALKAGASATEPDASNMTPLHYAARCGSVESVQILLGVDGVDVNALDNAGYAPLHYACMSNNALEVVKALFESKDLQPNTGTNAKAIMIAATKNDVETVKFILEHDGIDVDGVIRQTSKARGKDKKAKEISDLCKKYQKKYETPAEPQNTTQ